jgi:glycosyltransferase involved in cell wall biosynthesis
MYEAILCRLSAGYIGWSPYLAGRALTLGAPRAMTAANWPPESSATPPQASDHREEQRRRYGIPPAALVFGLVGSLHWNPRVAYCTGLELVAAVLRAERRDVCVVIVGDGDGLERLRSLAGPNLDTRVFLPGRVPRDKVPDFLATFDIGSLPHSADEMGAFRYTTKLSEYLAAGLPVVTGQSPLAYDLDEGWLWRLPGDAPWDDAYVDALTQLMNTVTSDDVEEKRESVPSNSGLFDAGRQQRQVSSFVMDIVHRHTPSNC